MRCFFLLFWTIIAHKWVQGCLQIVLIKRLHFILHHKIIILCEVHDNKALQRLSIVSPKYVNCRLSLKQFKMAVEFIYSQHKLFFAISRIDQSVVTHFLKSTGSIMCSLYIIWSLVSNFEEYPHPSYSWKKHSCQERLHWSWLRQCFSTISNVIHLNQVVPKLIHSITKQWIQSQRFEN